MHCGMHHASCSELGARSSEQRELGLGARACSELGVSEIGHRTRPASTHITAKTKNKTSYIIDDDISCSTPGATATGGYKIMINKRECPSVTAVTPSLPPGWMFHIFDHHQNGCVSRQCQCPTQNKHPNLGASQQRSLVVFLVLVGAAGQRRALANGALDELELAVATAVASSVLRLTFETVARERLVPRPRLEGSARRVRQAD